MIFGMRLKVTTFNCKWHAYVHKHRNVSIVISLITTKFYNYNGLYSGLSLNTRGGSGFMIDPTVTPNLQIQEW